MMLTRTEVVEAMRRSGIEPGMTIFCHANLAFFGTIANVSTMQQLVEFFYSAFLEVLGPSGTLVLPVFTYSFGSDKTERVFDTRQSFSHTSSLGNWLIKTGLGVRSYDPMLSVVAVGPKAVELTSDIDPICFGPRSVWSRLYSENALICNLNLDSGSTYLHWCERVFGVSYRTDIPMSGVIIDQDVKYQVSIIYTGRSLSDDLSVAQFEDYHTLCIDRGVSKTTSLGRGQIVTQSAQNAKALLDETLIDQPYLLTHRNRL